MTHRRLATLLALSLVAAAAQAVLGPWQRTEAREPCASFDLFRQPYFGDTHVHTAYSSDAVFAGTRENPRGAYRFAEGEPIGLPPYDAGGTPTRTAQLRRPLDFTAATDHAEQFGEIQICLIPGLPGYDSSDCVAARDQLAAPLPALPNLLPPPAVIAFLLGYGVLSPPQRFSWCGPGGADCLAEASLAWQDIQAAAEEFYDRTAACTFTTFAAYEWSGQPGGNNLHRNVIFRNAVVPALPTSYMEQPTPQGLWTTLQSQCFDGLPGCDVLAIPHNPNASGGLMFAPVNADGSPLTAADAAFRSSMEPVVEMNQHKGDSECRPGVQSTDEICGFEKLNRLQLFSPVSDPHQVFPPLNYLRNALKEGLVQEQRLGVNPFKLGMIGSTDTHNATPGATEEQDFRANGHLGRRDRAGSRRPQPSLRRPRGPRSRDADCSRDAAAEGTDRQGLGRCRRAVAREGVRGRRRSRQRRSGGRRHVHAVRHGLRLPVRGLERSGVQGGGARLLLRPRAREPDLPVEHLPLQRSGHRLQRPGRRAGRLRRVLQPRRREDHPGARLVVARLVSSRGRRARARRDAVRRPAGAGRPDARDRSRSHARGARSVDAGAHGRPA